MIINVKVIPNAKKEIVTEEVDLFGEKTYKVKTSKLPENGKANESVLELLSKHFNVRKNQITVIKGLTSTNKQIEIK